MWMSGSDGSGDPPSAVRGARAETRRVCVWRGIVWALLIGVGVSGCSPRVKVEAPDKPIEINVNVKIEQEVRIKLDEAVERTLTDNPELFGLEARP